MTTIRTSAAGRRSRRAVTAATGAQDDRLGRVNALVKMVSQGALPLGALAAGALFAALAPATAFGAVAAASFAATAILVFSPWSPGRGPGGEAVARPPT